MAVEEFFVGEHDDDCGGLVTKLLSVEEIFVGEKREGNGGLWDRCGMDDWFSGVCEVTFLNSWSTWLLNDMFTIHATLQRKNINKT